MSGEVIENQQFISIKELDEVSKRSNKGIIYNKLWVWCGLGDRR